MTDFARAVLCLLRIHVPQPGISSRHSRMWCCARCHALVRLEPAPVMMKWSSP